MRPSMARLTLARKIAAIIFNHVEERSEFRPQTVAATSSLSIAEEAPSIRRVPLLVVGRFLEMLGSREVSVNEIWPLRALGTESPISRYAPSDNQK
jgi:hypothetical protein